MVAEKFVKTLPLLSTVIFLMLVSEGSIGAPGCCDLTVMQQQKATTVNQKFFFMPMG
jgi:hypothetical protein